MLFRTNGENLPGVRAQIAYYIHLENVNRDTLCILGFVHMIDGFSKISDFPFKRNKIYYFIKK